MDPDHQENSWIVRRRKHQGESVTGRLPRMCAHRRACFRESTGRGKRSMHCRSSSLLCRQSHAVENLAYAWLLTLANQFEVSVSHAQGRSPPERSETREFRSRSFRGGTIEPVTSRDGGNFCRGQIETQHAEIRVAGTGDRGSQVHVAMPVRKPASAGSSAAGMARVAEIVLLPVGQRGERLQQRSHGNRLIGIIPARGQQATRACIHQQKRDVAVWRSPGPIPRLQTGQTGMDLPHE